MKVLIDINILIDVLAKREPHYAASAQVWEACDRDAISGYVPAVSLTNLHYIVRRLYGHEAAIAAIQQVLSAFEILDTTRAELESAAGMASRDFEDNVLIATADRHHLDFILTRDMGGFDASPVAAMAPAELVTRLANEGSEAP